MNEIINFKINDSLPDKNEILFCQGIKNTNSVSEKINSLVERAIILYSSIAEPKAILSEISKKNFKKIHNGEGLNEANTPIEKIYTKATKLCLFVSTIGNAVSKKINLLFENNDFALASMLDSVASAAADKTAELTEKHYYNYLIQSNIVKSNLVALRYSPGYCGWHISAQRKLFQALKPDKIGVNLRESFLMEPLKSVSGVIIIGPPQIHKIEKKYPFCKTCKSPTCTDRYLAISQ